jgi:hypothetical protein
MNTTNGTFAIVDRVPNRYQTTAAPREVVQ